MKSRFAIVTLVALFGSAAADAQEKPKPVSVPDFVQLVAKEEQAKAQSLLKDREGSAETKRSAKQTTAPSSSNAGATLVDAPSVVQLLGLAVDQNLVKGDASALTVDLNLFAFWALANHSVVVEQERYMEPLAVKLRRFGGSVSLGGSGEAFDQDADGKPDAAKAAESLTDIASVEARWRFRGTRDRRDGKSFKRYLAALDAVDQASIKAGMKMALVALAAIDRHDKENPNAPLLVPCSEGSQDKCVMSDRLSDLRAVLKAAAAPELTALGAAIRAFEETHAEVVKAIDRSAVWTVVANTTRQGASFGPSRIGAGLRGLVGRGAWDHTFNLDFQHADWRGGKPIATSWKLGYSASRLLSSNPDSESAAKVTFSLAGETYKNVPGATHDKLLKAGLRFDVPLSDSVTVPLSINYASHTDLLKDQKLLTAHLAVAWDFSGLTKKKAKE